MQLMSWTIARLGSRFGLHFEPYRKRVLHSALGRFLDQPIDLAVGLVEPDGTQRVLPFTQTGVDFANCEQFDRVNSITFRGYSESYKLRFEFNVHSVFYPQDERLCLTPALYLEMRVHPVERVRWSQSKGPTPDHVTLFLRLKRGDTTINVTAPENARGAIDLAYTNPLTPRNDYTHPTDKTVATPRTAAVHERIVSLNAGARPAPEGDGLLLDLPVTAEDTGIKWRLVWAVHTPDPVLRVQRDGQVHDAPFRYARWWKDVDEVLAEAIDKRDEWLAQSRRFEKLIGQAPLDTAQRHLLNQSFHAYLSNTFWCAPPSPGTTPDTPAAASGASGASGGGGDWFSVWEGSCFFHSTLDVAYNESLLYFTLWPKLLEMQLHQWAEHSHPHAPSGGAWLSHDMGAGCEATGQAYPHPMEVEENCNYLLLLQCYAHWTGDTAVAQKHAPLVERLARYLLWTDRDASGFPSEGVANTIDDASPAVQFARKQTYLAVKRLAALRAASDLLKLSSAPGSPSDLALTLDRTADADLRKVERAAWLGDHYAVCVDTSTVGINDVWTGKPLTEQTIKGWDAYSIYTGNGTLLPTMCGQPPLLDLDKLRRDIYAATRENIGRYGCGHTSSEPENVWISQNLWRDMLARYMKLEGASLAPLYWDMQVMSNTHGQSLGFIDTYINNYLCFYPRGIASIGYFLATPRLIVDRLAPGGSYLTVDPDRGAPQRWPLLPLADWKAGKIPVVVVDESGRVSIEGEIDPIIIYGGAASPEATATSGLIG